MKLFDTIPLSTMNKDNKIWQFKLHFILFIYKEKETNFHYSINNANSLII